jgi:hypothetical protein
VNLEYLENSLIFSNQFASRVQPCATVCNQLEPLGTGENNIHMWFCFEMLGFCDSLGFGGSRHGTF